MASAGRPQLKALELTVVSAKHLKNVNWRNGDLKPYAVFWLDPDSKLATKPDDSGSTRPVWNERFTLPLPLPLHDASLTIEIFHSKPSATPKPLVGAVRVPLTDLVGSIDSNSSPLKTLDLRRPSGRSQGKIRLKLILRERPSPPSPPPAADYHINPSPSGYFYSTGISPPPPRDYRGYSTPYSTGLLPPPPVPAAPPSQYGYGNYSDPYSAGYYSSTHYSHAPSPPPPPPPRPFYGRLSSNGGPSAPVDFSSGSSYYDEKPKGSKMGLGTGMAVGALAGGLTGLALNEGLKYEEDKVAEKVEKNLAARDDYSEYSGDY
ncbi:protein SRC2 homolog [Aristolochia californica]|uniref:protein SRC2 homolog n=1 Tax=Aristolochia californica TaxID=171875 RepID=UPI0035DCDE12